MLGTVQIAISEEYSCWIRERKDFDAKYKNSTANKIKLFFGFYKNQLALHNQKLREICDQAGQKFPMPTLFAHYEVSVKNKSFAKNINIDKKFLKSVLRSHFERIDRREDSVGFTWKVKNNETGVVHYVVGTSHAATKNMLKNASIKEAVQNTKLLITELKGNRVLLFLRKLEYILTGSSTKYAVDDAMIQWAWKQKKKNIGLETVKQQITIATGRPTAKYLSSIGEIIKLTRLQLHMTNHLAADCWQKGEEASIPLQNFSNALLRNRNTRWLREVPISDSEGKNSKGIIDLLKNTKTPTCIAVGLAHCLGGEREQGLIHILQKNGFEIERILPDDSAITKKEGSAD